MSNIAKPELTNPAASKPKARERYCFNCGDSLGVIEDRYYDRRDTCGKRECEREARDEEAAEYYAAHEQLDRDNGWGSF